MKSMKKVGIILLCLLLLLFIVNDFTIQAQAFSWQGTIDSQAKASANNNVVKSTKTLSGAILTIAKIVCASIAVIMLIAVGMKYMVSAPGDRADIKKHAIPYVVGAVIMFASTAILQIIQNFAATIA